MVFYSGNSSLFEVMKILLIRYHDKNNINTRLPQSLNKIQGVLPPLGLSYIASFLERKGYEAEILDVQALNLTSNQTFQFLKDCKPDIVGVTSMTSNVWGAFEVTRLAKETGAITVLGGPQLASFPRETLFHNFVDFGIIGEGEYAFWKLVKSFEEGSSFENIRGLVYRKNKDIIVNEPDLVEHLDELPFPARHLLPMNKYSSIIGLHPVTTMITSRGCPFKCGFCSKQPSDKKYRTRSPKNVVDEMEEIVKKYKIKEIMFYDDVITLKRSHIVGICEEILKRGLKVKWESPTRVDCVDESLLRLMHKAGCIRLRYGVESGDPRILELMNKKIDISLIKRIFKLTRRIGIETFAYFIIGYISETYESYKKTLKLAMELDIDLAMFTMATPYPNTEFYKMAVSKNLIERDYWSRFTKGTNVNTRLPYFINDAERLIENAYRRFYLRAGFILKMLMKLKNFITIRKYFYAAKSLLFFKTV